MALIKEYEKVVQACDELIEEMKEMPILLTPVELSQLKGNEWKDGRWYYDPYEIMGAQLKKVADYIENQPTDGHDKWYFYNKDLAKSLREEAGLT